MEDELAKLRQRIEDISKEVNRKLQSNSGAALGSTKDLQLFSQSIEQRLADMDEKIGEKANKQTVAQALHRKANKPEIESVLAKKADISDL